MQTRRLLHLIVLLTMLASILSACLQKEPEPVTIYYYRRGYVEGGDDAASQKARLIVESFQKRYPYITVNLVGIPVTTEGTEQLYAALESREKINVFSITPNMMPNLVRKGILSNIEPFMTRDDKTDYYENALQMATVNGKVYAWPQWVTAVAMYGNPAIFEERGVTVPSMDNPWTWDEFVEASRQLTFTREDGTQVYAFSTASAPGQSVYMPIFYMNGGRVRSPDGRTFTMNQPEAVSALQNFANLHLVENVTPPDFGTVGQNDVHTQFKAGTLAMMMETPAVITELQTEGIPFVVFPNPVGETGQLVTSGGYGLFAVAQVDDENALKASHLLARYLTSLEIAQDIPGYQLAPSLRRSNTLFATDDARNVVSQLVAYGVYEAPVDISVDVENQLQLALQSILLGEKTAQQAMDEIAPVYQKALDEQALSE